MSDEDLDNDNLATLDDEQIREYAEMAQAEIERLEAENADLRSRTSSTLPVAVKAAASALIGRIDRGEPVRGFESCVEVVARWCLDELADQDRHA
ncbi:MAG: hypothetical protein GY708_12975 [Actinomycetia bacterium]|nr:hypothetical protein [Actinomycetes bacterium]